MSATQALLVVVAVWVLIGLVAAVVMRRRGQRYALEHEFDVLVAGRRGHGASRALLGSVAIQLARESRSPVLLAGPALPESA